MTESSKKIMSLSIWTAIILFALRCWISWDDISIVVSEKMFFQFAYSIFGYAGEAIGFTVVFMACFNRWLWRWGPLNFLAGGMPVLAKHYKGKIRFNWEDKDQERESEICIEQTFLNVIIKLGTNESSSNSITASIKEVNGSKLLIYTYINTPRAELQNRSEIHYGTAMLNIDDPKHITGNYYTTRLSRGSMDLEVVKKDV